MSYVIVAPRLELDKMIAANTRTNLTAATPAAPAPGPRGVTVADTAPTIVTDVDGMLRGLTPEQIAALNQAAAARTMQPLVAEGDAVLGGRVEVTGDELGPHARGGA